MTTEAPDFMDQFDDHVGATGNELQRVALLAEQMLAAQREVALCEVHLTRATEHCRKITEEDLPALMKELRLKEFKLEDGTRIEVQEMVQCGISEERRPRAHQWLKDHEFGGLIKTEIAVAFDRTEVGLAADIAERLRIMMPDKEVAVEERVHPSTLKSFIKEQMEAGATPPMDLFAIRPFDRAKATLPKIKAAKK